MKACAIAVLFGIAVSSARAQPQAKKVPSIYGTFSSLQMVQESGDVVGYEITILPQSGRSYAVFQCAEGAPAEPVLVPLKVDGTHFSFSIVQTGTCDGNYVAMVTTKGMMIHASGWTKSERLLRGSSYWSRRH